MTDNSTHVTAQEALRMHASGRPGKVEIRATKPLTTQRDLSLAYSPGVAAPCLEIQKDPDTVYDYTARGNRVAVISNGTAVLGLGNLGALASKPVMEGKSVLFKKFADVDGIDLEVDTTDVDEFVDCVRCLGPGFGGINLEDIKAPECFVIEQRLREIMDIPVFHDDQHGTAIIVAAAVINAIDLSGRTLSESRFVVNGAGSAAIACVALLKSMGAKPDNMVMCDTKGVIHKDRKEGMNQWKSAHSVNTKMRTLDQAMKGADVFLGLSVKGAVSQAMVESMAEKPIVFALANPDPEITPEEVEAVRPDAIVATGRSDYPNQINNVLGFPYIFRGALDVRASTINDAMKIAAAEAISKLAREDVPDEVDAAYSGKHLKYGRDYIIPAPFDPRLMTAVPMAVAGAAMDSGVARNPIIDMDAYRNQLSARLDPTAGSLQAFFEQVRKAPKRVVFAEGEEEKSIRAAIGFHHAGYGTPVLIGSEDRIKKTIKSLGLAHTEGLEILNAKLSDATGGYMDYLYGRLQRNGVLFRDCRRMVNQDRNTFAACMVAVGDADAMVTGLTRNYHVVLGEIARALDPALGKHIFGMSILVARGKTVFLADTSVHELPNTEQFVDSAIHTAALARQLGHEPRVALISFSNFGNPDMDRSRKMRAAVEALDARKVDFEYDGEMTIDVALDAELMKRAYPFCRLSGPANVLIMPGLHSSSASSMLVGKLGGGTVIGPLLTGLAKPAQIVPMGATVSDIVNMAALAAHDAIRREKR